jgi:hypothetical protein
MYHYHDKEAAVTLGQCSSTMKLSLTYDRTELTLIITRPRSNIIQYNGFRQQKAYRKPTSRGRSYYSAQPTHFSLHRTKP